MCQRPNSEMGPAENRNKRVICIQNRRRRRKKKRRNLYSEQSKRAASKGRKNPADKRILNELFATNLCLEKLLQYKAKGAILRSKVLIQKKKLLPEIYDTVKT